MDFMVKALNFGLELAALFFLAHWGWRLEAALWLRVLVATALPILALVCLGLWATPRSSLRLNTSARFAFQGVFYGVVCFTLLSQGASVTALVFGGLVLAMWALSALNMSVLAMRK